MAPKSTLKKLVRAPVKRLRRAFVPEYEGLLAQSRELGELHQQVDELRARVELFEDLRARVDLIHDGLHEARRLNLRIAQLTDVVTELVLPLHDRDIDPKVFDALAEDTQ